MTLSPLTQLPELSTFPLLYSNWHSNPVGVIVSDSCAAEIDAKNKLEKFRKLNKYFKIDNKKFIVNDFENYCCFWIYNKKIFSYKNLQQSNNRL